MRVIRRVWRNLFSDPLERFAYYFTDQDIPHKELEERERKLGRVSHHVGGPTNGSPIEILHGYVTGKKSVLAIKADWRETDKRVEQVPEQRYPPQKKRAYHKVARIFFGAAVRMKEQQSKVTAADPVEEYRKYFAAAPIAEFSARLQRLLDVFKSMGIPMPSTSKGGSDPIALLNVMAAKHDDEVMVLETTVRSHIEGARHGLTSQHREAARLLFSAVRKKKSMSPRPW